MTWGLLILSIRLYNREINLWWLEAFIYASFLFELKGDINLISFKEANFE